MLKTVNNFNSRKEYILAVVRVSVEEHCVLCEVRTLCQAVITVTVKFKLRLKK
jgi:hypothetical protein